MPLPLFTPGSLKIRPPEITLAAWVRDMRPAFHAKPSPNAGGQRSVVAALNEDVPFHQAAAVLQGLRTC